MTPAWIVMLAIAPAFAVLIYLQARNLRVGHFRVELIRQIGDAAERDLRAGLTVWQWRYDVLHTVSYDRMLFSVKALHAENYYRDLTFLSPSSAASQQPAHNDDATASP